MADDLTREITARPAFDCLRVQPCVHGSDACKPGSGGSHGRSSVRMLFVLKGDHADLTFEVFTGWPHPATPPSLTAPAMAGGVTFHADAPWYDGMDAEGGCPRWGDCYSDVGFLLGDEAFVALREGGTDGLWSWMERLYRETFEGAADGA